MLNTCECGCGQHPGKNHHTGIQNRFITGHNSKIWKIRKPRVAFTCLYCHKTEEHMPSIGNMRKFCSTECRDQYRREMTGELNPHFKRFFTPCAKCGKTTERVLKHGTQRPVYCSKECAAASKSEKISAALKKRRSDTWNCWRKLAKERDGNACKICGFSLITHAHHIEHKAKGGKHHMDNLITLCPNHHAMAHTGLLSKDEMLAAIHGQHGTQ